MVTKANRQRSRKKPQHQSDDVYIPASLKKIQGCGIDANAITALKAAQWKQVEPPKVDPLSDMCGEPWHPVAIYAISASIAFCGGLGMGWLVWA